MQLSCSARVSQRQPGLAPVLVRQRDDIVVDPLLQLLDLLGRRLGSEHALCLRHRSISHCCRGEGGQCLPARGQGRGGGCPGPPSMFITCLQGKGQAYVSTSATAPHMRLQWGARLWLTL